MLIILDGIDGCGKSTVAQKLVEMKGHKKWHPAQPQKPWDLYAARIRGEYEVITDLAEIDIFKTIDLVCDRFTPSEYAYLEDYEEGQKDISYVWRIDERLADLKEVLYVYLVCDWEVTLQRLHDKDEIGQYTVGDRKRYSERYNKYFEMSKIRKMKIDTTELSIERTVHTILGRLPE